jgi:hypothetical protein
MKKTSSNVDDMFSGGNCKLVGTMQSLRLSSRCPQEPGRSMRFPQPKSSRYGHHADIAMFLQKRGSINGFSQVATGAGTTPKFFPACRLVAKYDVFSSSRRDSNDVRPPPRE